MSMVDSSSRLFQNAALNLILQEIRHMQNARMKGVDGVGFRLCRDSRNPTIEILYTKNRGNVLIPQGRNQQADCWEDLRMAAMMIARICARLDRKNMVKIDQGVGESVVIVVSRLPEDVEIEDILSRVDKTLQLMDEKFE